jgi:hypothetical protein
MRKEKLNKIEIIENKLIKLKPKKHKMDLQLLPTDIIKNIELTIIITGRIKLEIRAFVFCMPAKISLLFLDRYTS